MIAVDTSALMAIVLGEPQADALIAVLEAEDDLLISAGTVAEALIVSARRNVGDEMEQLIDGLGFEIVAVTPASARRIAEVYRTWGKGAHPASLNFGDCFAYEVAREHGCRLLFVGDDFVRTDIENAL
ncbi:type II toxin-antitoxin system VapC family toxin [Rhizobium leguminosarum]|uniref:type II toxin-antitoxin system VapC family toxin n=1 Tax=Rhizobium leguminosarum TaxID=384 RepID=UPI001C914CA7|nr:type II toxin-antitoxin system VapC family toxin [Rhizobium leguminosarum]MBY2917864.1 type II toxin-antitoxin system VapC family toxin [Rhizobium leguminosarum]MBY2973213.1 type II toxin-antitoxin system VapC family toxin [Rhizobium leguminosarum]MBY2980613.1 type II toxin-antitoxin system VapC family toxin [Rhizobium leguminosarum]MBY3009164.1 type II toxin-antitoxin system VapC family toxin [Rhizobium leguminosarum]